MDEWILMVAATTNFCFLVEMWKTKTFMKNRCRMTLHVVLRSNLDSKFVFISNFFPSQKTPEQPERKISVNEIFSPFI